MKRFAIALISAVGLMGTLGSAARGDYVLNPGATVSTPLADVYNNGSSSLAPGAVEISAQNSSLAGSLTASVSEEVFREAGGTLDFLFQLNDSASSNQSILNAVASNFAGVTTSVGFTTTLPVQATIAVFTQTGTVGVSSASRNASGDPITFTFASPVAAGSSSDIFFIRTNATAYNFGGTLTANGASGSSVLTGSFAPVASSVVPEPASIILCGLAGVIGLGYALHRRRAVTV